MHLRRMIPGNVLFVTGNSDPSGTTYDGVTNIQESVVKVSPNLTNVVDLFTPSNQASLDQTDADFGSGGVLVLPDQPGSIPHLAVAAGKNGQMYFMNEDKLGGYSTVKNNVIAIYSIGKCWCGQSYFVDPTDGLGRVVSSGGHQSGSVEAANFAQSEVDLHRRRDDLRRAVPRVLHQRILEWDRQPDHLGDLAASIAGGRSWDLRLQPGARRQ